MAVIRHLLARAIWYLWKRFLLWARAFLPPLPPRDLPPPLRVNYAEGVEWMVIGLVGGIESIVIDGKRWFFGFSNDTVISPLIDDAHMMAAFASRYMLQMDGVHGRKYWSVLVEESIGSSELTGDDDAQRTFTTSEFRRIASKLAAAEAGNHAVPDFTIEYHLLYLLSAAVGDVPDPDDAAYVSAIRKLGLSKPNSTMGYALQAMEMLSGSSPLLGFSTHGDAAAAVRVCLSALVNRARGNWRTIFQDLAPA